MADLEITEQPSQPTINNFTKRVYLRAGDKLLKDMELVALANKTIPQGYVVTALININFIAEKV